MAWALASGIEGNDSAGKEQKYQQEQARIDLALLQIKSDAAAGIITWEVAQTRTNQWVTNNYSRLQKQAALAAELDQISPLPADPVGKPNWADSPFPAGTPQATRFRKLEEEEALAMAKIPKQASPEERQRLTDVWAQGNEGAGILGEKRKLLADENQRQAALPPPAPAPPPANASLTKRAQADIAIRRHALLQEVYTRNPNASPKERQILIDQERAKFEALDVESAAINLEAIKEDIDAQTSRLTAIANEPVPVSAPVPTPSLRKK